MSALIRPITFEDNAAIQEIIETVMPEFCAGGDGFAIHDADVKNMYQAYQRARSCYFVCELDGVVVGGGGISPLAGTTGDVCELQKMYFLPTTRGVGLGRKMLTKCIEQARLLKFRQCYLETLHTMTAAKKLYEQNGFKQIQGPLGNTGHFGCDTFYLLAL